MASLFFILVVFLYVSGFMLMTEGYELYQRQHNMQSGVYKVANGWLLLIVAGFVLVCMEHADFWEPLWCKGISAVIMALGTFGALDQAKCPTTGYVVGFGLCALYVYGVFWV